MGTWIDFKELRNTLKIAEVLKHHGVELKVKGDRATGFCPLKSHQGKRHSPSFSANLARNIWQCFGCAAKGNAIELFAALQGFNPGDPQQFREAALLAQETFGIGSDAPQKPRVPKVQTASVPSEREVEPPVDRPKPPDNRPRIINGVLDFTLKKLDADHPYLASRGFTPETIAHFGLGFCGRGLLEGRIAIPLHDDCGNLVGYAGRIVDDSAIGPDHPKYLLPSERERNGTVYEFRKSKLLYNAHEFRDPLDDLIVVEGFPSVWWLRQCGFPNAVALMGASCSPEQAEIIARAVNPDGRIWILADGDEAGDRCAQSIFGLVGPHRFCRWVKLPPGKQPTDCAPQVLATLLPPIGFDRKEVIHAGDNDNEGAD
jgi:DNA primase